VFVTVITSETESPGAAFPMLMTQPGGLLSIWIPGMPHVPLAGPEPPPPPPGELVPTLPVAVPVVVVVEAVVVDVVVLVGGGGFRRFVVVDVVVVVVPAPPPGLPPKPWFAGGTVSVGVDGGGGTGTPMPGRGSFPLSSVVAGAGPVLPMSQWTFRPPPATRPAPTGAGTNPPRSST
jgi:hypothetical protein